MTDLINFILSIFLLNLAIALLFAFMIELKGTFNI